MLVAIALVGATLITVPKAFAQNAPRYMVSAVDLEIAPAQLDKFLEALRENGQPSVGKFEVPNWDPVSQKKIRDALSELGTMLGDMPGAMFGSK
ncbi:MAG: hypothetical protein WBZ28_11255, partial [Pseudolabrys sp.]